MAGLSSIRKQTSGHNTMWVNFVGASQPYEDIVDDAQLSSRYLGISLGPNVTHLD